MKLTFGKNKKLKSRKAIEKLFAEGKNLQKKPLSMVYRFSLDSEAEFKFAVSVPKRLFKKAHERNLLKRRIREAFRIHQNELKTNSGLDFMFIYTSNKMLDFGAIEKSVISLISDLNSLSADNISAE
jgi:ribonuclease P protein component